MGSFSLGMSATYPKGGYPGQNIRDSKRAAELTYHLLFVCHWAALQPSTCHKLFLLFDASLQHCPALEPADYVSQNTSFLFKIVCQVFCASYKKRSQDKFWYQRIGVRCDTA